MRDVARYARYVIVCPEFHRVTYIRSGCGYASVT